MDDGCTVEGLDELCKTLQEMGTTLVRKALRDALDYAGAQMQIAAIEKAPIAAEGTKEHPAGQLKADIRRKVVIANDGVGICAVYPSKHSFYGSFLEFGTSRQKSTPWLRPAFDASVGTAQDVFMQVFNAYLEDFAKRKK